MKIPEELYQEILRSMPIPCVDLLVTNPRGEVLLVKRSTPPALGHWWFPGGRVLYRELRSDAARRKLLDECGLTAIRLRELGTYDLILETEPGQPLSHAVSTLYHVEVQDSSVRLDHTSSDSAWKSPQAWMSELTDGFPLSALRAHAHRLRTER